VQRFLSFSKESGNGSKQYMAECGKILLYVEVSTTGKAGGLISPKRAAILATLKGYPPLGITLRIIGLLPCSDY